MSSELSPADDFDMVVKHTPVVLGSVAHWLFTTRGVYSVLALDVDGAGSTACIGLPPESALGSAAIPRNQMLLSPTADGRLCLLAGEETRISVWALAAVVAAAAAGGSGGDTGWLLHATYEREWIARFAARARAHDGLFGAGRRQ